jgi:DNA polymerase I-like protein with 3'-5' exonuclease and polymerase domains
LSYGFAKDRAKQAAAIMQSQPVAHATKMALLRDDPRIIDALQVHDEILMYVDARHDPRKVKGWIQEKMDVEMDGLKGLRLPVDVSYGAREKSPNQTSNWADQVKL